MRKKSFATLIKLQKTLVDEQRQKLARLAENLERLEGRIAQLQAMKAREHEAAQQDPVARMTYGAFVKMVIVMERDLGRRRHEAALELYLAQDKLAELFEEQKRYEIAEGQRLEEIAREELRIETLMLDEIGSVMHERKRNEN
jgi:hypothetical protein